jgi:hypothetical protein
MRAEHARGQGEMLALVKRTETDLTVEAEPGSVDKSCALHELDEVGAHDVFERVEGLEVADADFELRPPAGVFEVSVLDGGYVVGEVDLELVVDVFPYGAFDAKARAPDFKSVDVGKIVLVDRVVVEVQTTAHLHLELAVLAGELRRALPFHFQVEVIFLFLATALAGSGLGSRRRVGRSRLRSFRSCRCGTRGRSGAVVLFDLALQALDLRLHDLQLRCKLLICIRTCARTARRHESDDAAAKQVAPDIAFPVHVALHGA